MKDGIMEDMVVSVQGLSHSYGKLRAVDKISFEIKKGQIFSVFGTRAPSFSQKTCCVE
jgi:ABC-type branched-subunit amino acid transport system ATPase component